MISGAPSLKMRNAFVGHIILPFAREEILLLNAESPVAAN
jgi:hypothetical protein